MRLKVRRLPVGRHLNDHAADFGVMGVDIVRERPRLRYRDGNQIVSNKIETASRHKMSRFQPSQGSHKLHLAEKKPEKLNIGDRHDQ